MYWIGGHRCGCDKTKQLKSVAELERDPKLKIQQFLRLLIKWNPVCKLVSRQDTRHLQVRHVDDSLGLSGFIQNDTRVMDIGPGGGFPSIPLSIAFPSISFVLVERSEKKSQFLQYVKLELGLQNVEIFVQDVRHLDVADSGFFDSITARAVADPTQLWHWSRRFLREDGQLLLQTTQCNVSELSEAMIHPSVKVKRGFVTAVERLAP